MRRGKQGTEADGGLDEQTRTSKEKSDRGEDWYKPPRTKEKSEGK